MEAIKWNKETKSFSEKVTDKRSFIDKYCKVIDSKNQFIPDSPWVEVIMNGCYLTSGKSLEDILSDKDEIDLLIKYGITEVYSSFTKDKYHPYPVVNYGFNPVEQKWYGWSHRAIHSFGIGDEAVEFYPDKEVHNGKITTLEEAKQAAIKFAESVN